ncbi:hypothetical protein [Sandaracinus amylolyticus]|uniref:hypothetical protein n=1 Tax=Sandaracinus amylolyticus TaxID=927083 RepID=UPI001F3B13F6|nr:hypothetical protein [Sandaracinus amylolyticus]UJR85480.1 Hypothetical protein I5071_75600 [Sandaracinus amylolyticus]
MTIEPTTQPPEHDPFAPPPPRPKEVVRASATELLPEWNGRRIAGICLFFTAITSMLDLGLAIQMGDSPSPRAAMPIVFDLIIGGSLVLQQDRFLGWALARAALGGVVWSVIHAAQGNYCAIPLQLMASGALIGLLAGEAPRGRIIASLVVFGLFLLTYGGLVVLALLFGA